MTFPIGYHDLNLDLPAVAALSISGSTLIVAINTLKLKRTHLEGIRAYDPVSATTALTSDPYLFANSRRDLCFQRLGQG